MQNQQKIQNIKRPNPFFHDETTPRLRLYVVFVELNGDRIPWDWCESDVVGKVMVEASETFGEECVVSVSDIDSVSNADLKKLRERLNLYDSWDEFIDLPSSTCKGCGGTGFVTMLECDHNCEVYEIRGDCEMCDSNGEI